MLYMRRYRVDVADNLLARKHLTQVRILRRALAILVIIVTIARSGNRRIEKAFSPKGELIRPELLSPGSTCAVEDSASGRPSASEAAGLKPRVR